MQEVIRGMEQALEHARGGSNGTKVRQVRVPDHIDVRAIRERLGVSQAEFAIRFGFSLASLRNWEQGRRFPDGPARTLLKVIEVDPEAVESAVLLGSQLTAALNGHSKEQILSTSVFRPKCSKVTDLLQQLYLEKDINEIQGTGYVIDSLG